MITVQYQNIDNGHAHDISTLITDAKFKTVRSGSPSSFEFTLLKDAAIKIDNGGIVAVKDDNQGLFYGYVFRYSRKDDGKIDVTAYDQMRYLKNKDTYVIKGKRADEVLGLIAADFKIKIGALSNTGYVIPSMVEDGQTLFDIVLKALDLTLINAKQIYYLWDDYGKLRISNVKDQQINLIIGDSSLATGYSYESSIDSDTANRIKLVRDNKKTGKRDVYIVEDSSNKKRWGILQHYDKVDEDMNPAQIEAMANNLIALKNRPTRTLDIDAIADLSVRAGRSIFVVLSDLGVKGWHIVEECEHDLIKETMTLKLVIK